MKPTPKAQILGAAPGFTLIETLAALVIGSVIILATATLVHDVALRFDQGTRRVQDAERLMLALERLSRDFGSTRFVTRKSESGQSAAFTGHPTSVLFIADAGISVGPQGEEVVSLTVEQDDDVARLVRRRGAWPGPRTRPEEVSLGDPVVLIEGRVDIGLAYGRLMTDAAAPPTDRSGYDDTGPKGLISWSDNWSGEFSLPRFVRLTLRDRSSGADLFPGAEFIIRSDAPPSCTGSGGGGATGGCLSPQAPGGGQQPGATPPGRGTG